MPSLSTAPSRSSSVPPQTRRVTQNCRFAPRNRRSESLAGWGLGRDAGTVEGSTTPGGRVPVSCGDPGRRRSNFLPSNLSGHRTAGDRHLWKAAGPSGSPKGQAAVGIPSGAKLSGTDDRGGGRVPARPDLSAARAPARPCQRRSTHDPDPARRGRRGPRAARALPGRRPAADRSDLVRRSAHRAGRDRAGRAAGRAGPGRSGRPGVRGGPRRHPAPTGRWTCPRRPPRPGPSPSCGRSPRRTGRWCR